MVLHEVFQGAPMVLPWGFPCFHGASVGRKHRRPRQDSASVVLPSCFRGGHGIHGVSLRYTWCLHGSTVIPWYCHRASMVLHGDFHGAPMVFSWGFPCFHGASVGRTEAQCFHGDFHGGSMVVPWGLPWDFHGSTCLLYTSPSPRDQRGSRMPSSA